MKKYLTISRYEDEPYAAFLTQEQLEQKLKEEWEDYTFLNSAPGDLMNFPSKSVLIVKGEIIVPKPKKVVTEWVV
jgi:hypothetical protein